MSKKINEKITDRGNKSPPEVEYNAGDEFCIDGSFSIVSWDIDNYAVKCRMQKDGKSIDFTLPATLTTFISFGLYIHPCDLPKEHEDYLVWKDQDEEHVYRPSDRTTYKLMLSPNFKISGKYWLVDIPKIGHPKAKISKRLETDDLESMFSKLMYKRFDGSKVKGKLVYFTMLGTVQRQHTLKEEDRLFVTRKMKKKVVDNESSRYDIRFYVDIEGIQFFLNHKVLNIG